MKDDWRKCLLEPDTDLNDDATVWDSLKQEIAFHSFKYKKAITSPRQEKAITVIVNEN